MTAESRPTRTRWLRLGLSLLIAVHLIAVVSPPLAFQTRGPLGLSPSIDTLIRPVEGYSQFLYMDRGYAFFAPEPGPSHLLQAAIGSETGTVERMYPDREDQWPRLLYHRHFMITEFLEEIYQPPGPPEALLQIDPVEAEYWQRRRARYEHVRQSIVDHLRHENPGREVAVRRIEHLIPDLNDFRRDPIELTDPRLYQVLLDEPIELDDLGELSAPSAPPESIPSPSGEPQSAEQPESGNDSRSDAKGATDETSPLDSDDLQRTPLQTTDVQPDDAAPDGAQGDAEPDGAAPSQPSRSEESSASPDVSAGDAR
jgi:hypothetical protein